MYIPVKRTIIDSKAKEKTNLSEAKTQRLNQGANAMVTKAPNKPVNKTHRLIALTKAENLNKLLSALAAAISLTALFCNPKLVIDESKAIEELNNPIIPNPVVPSQTAISFDFRTLITIVIN